MAKQFMPIVSLGREVIKKYDYIIRGDTPSRRLSGDSKRKKVPVQKTRNNANLIAALAE
jgi:hypothetical protein